MPISEIINAVEPVITLISNSSVVEPVLALVSNSPVIEPVFSPAPITPIESVLNAVPNSPNIASASDVHMLGYSSESEADNGNVVSNPTVLTFREFLDGKVSKIQSGIRKVGIASDKMWALFDQNREISETRFARSIAHLSTLEDDINDLSEIAQKQNAWWNYENFHSKRYEQVCDVKNRIALFEEEKKVLERHNDLMEIYKVSYKRDLLDKPSLPTGLTTLREQIGEYRPTTRYTR